jgi:cell division protease FtsH
VDKKTHINIAYAVAAFIAILLFQGGLAARQQVETVSFSEFEQLLKDGKIEAVNVHGILLDGKLKKPLPDGRQLYSTVLVAPEERRHRWPDGNWQKQGEDLRREGHQGHLPGCRRRR